VIFYFFFFQAEDGIRDRNVTGVQTCALPIFAEVDPVLDPDLGTQHADHAVQHDGDTTEYATRHRRDQCPELGGEAEEDRDQCSDVIRRGGVDAGRGHDTDVLRVRGGARATDGGRDDGTHAVSGDRLTHHRVEIVTGHLRDRLDVPGVLRDKRDDCGQDQQDERDVEAGQVPADGLHTVGVHDRLGRQAEPVGLPYAVEVDPEAGGDVVDVGVVRGDLTE